MDGYNMLVYAAVVLILLLLGYYFVDYLVRLPWVPGLHKKCIVITGCDSGFGNALAKSLYRRGVFVFAGCYTENGAKRLMEETGERLKTFRLDVSKTESIEEGFKFVKQNLPQNSVLWGLVNNAGIPGYWAPVEFISRQDAMEMFQVNCLGMMEMVRVFLPLLKSSRGRIVNMCSLAGKLPFPMVATYAASKTALLGFSESLRLEKVAWGISVSTICPGPFQTAVLDPVLIRDRVKQAKERFSPAMKQIADEDYGKEFFEKAEADQIASTTRGFTDLSPVVSAYEQALFSRKPRPIYYPGFAMGTLIMLHKWYPSYAEQTMAATLMTATPKALLK